ncbi:hypothetical protein [Candidatus Methylomicrobium oryzae]|uniref:hypothetical protein n=1 Tax=Candidatus Methylomicrobium oryzae TaxID=2802053 RepID=UPI001922A533|nr:hypothetical protein [Methylomicrobium sp. RS1]MBL1264795.1 hypothetical protein [Methylomicrobium sp. RS1]
MNCLQWWNYPLCDIAAAELLIKESLGQILDACDLRTAFRRFWSAKEPGNEQSGTISTSRKNGARRHDNPISR